MPAVLTAMPFRTEAACAGVEGRSRAGGWLSVEMLLTVAAGVALLALGWKYYGDSAQRAENRQKAIVAVWEVSAFLARAETGVRDIPDIIQDGQGFELPGGDFAGRASACRLDTGEPAFTPETVGFQHDVRTCVPCLGSGAGWVPLAGVGPVNCPTGGGLPIRCTTRQDMLSALPVVAGTARSVTPPFSEISQGIWIPADSLQDAIEIQHLFVSDPHFSRLPDLAISRRGDATDPTATAGVFICI